MNKINPIKLKQIDPNMTLSESISILNDNYSKVRDKLAEIQAAITPKPNTNE